MADEVSTSYFVCFGAQDHTDYYVPNGRPKKLWLKELPPHACAQMCARELPPTSQAAEGGGGLIITLCRHEDGRPVALTVARGKKEDSEDSALLADPQAQLADALVTADPLHNKEATVRVILDQGGDYLIGTKANTAQRLAAATQALAGTPFLH